MSRIGFLFVSGKIWKLMRVLKMSVMSQHEKSNNLALQVNLCQKLFFLQNTGRTCCVQKLFLTFRTISVQNMFSPCPEKRRASEKKLPVVPRNYVLKMNEL